MEAKRTRLPDRRQGFTSKNQVGNHEFYVTVNFWPDDPHHDRPAEVFINIAKEGSTLGGMCDALARTISFSLQFGVPWSDLSRAYRNMQFEPSGEGRDLHGKAIHYPSLPHAIAATIDDVLAHRRHMWGDVERPEEDGGTASVPVAGGPTPPPLPAMASVQERPPELRRERNACGLPERGTVLVESGLSRAPDYAAMVGGKPITPTEGEVTPTVLIEGRSAPQS